MEIPQNSDFSLQNLPFGVCSMNDGYDPSRRFCVTAIGSKVVDLNVLQDAGLFRDISDLSDDAFSHSTLNDFLSHPSSVWASVRQRLVQLLSSSPSSSSSSMATTLKDDLQLQKAAFIDQSQVTMHLPVSIGDYTDFYSSREHATNCGTMFRSKENALQPNWLHLPVGYHGRSSTVVCSGTDVRRPWGQVQKDPTNPSCGSIHKPCQRLDFELEVAFYVGGPPNPIGTPLTMEQAKDRIFGFCLMNDWSARDLQKWEYVPLGPFTAKNFATSVSPWIVPMAALEPYRCITSAGPTQDNPTPLPYLTDPEYSSYDITLTASILSLQDKQLKKGPHAVCKSNFRNLYWNAAQQLVHHSVTGCQMNPGDLLASGTISGQTQDSFGSMLELSWNGSQDVCLGDCEKDTEMETRKFLNDHDTVIFHGWCGGEGQSLPRVGFGECSGTILPALESPNMTTSVLTPKDDHPIIYDEFTLYSYWRSSSAWKVRIALEAKQIPYKIIPIDISTGENKAIDFLRDTNPMGQVPVLEFQKRQGDTTTKCRITQSVAIMEFLDHAFPKRPLLFPKDPMDRVMASEMVQLINSGIQPLQNGTLIKDLEIQSEGKIVARDFAATVIIRGLLALEELIAKRKGNMEGSHRFYGPFCMGNFSPSIVDVCLIPQLDNARRFGIKVDEQFPALAAIDHLCETHPWFIPAHAKVQIDAKTETFN
jgi:fumarylacetoacetase